MIEPERIREAAREVLGRPEFEELDESLLAEWLGRARSWIADALDTLLGSGAASGIGQIVAFGVVTLVVVGAVVLLLGLRRPGASPEVVEIDGHTDARALAAAAAAARDSGDHEAAVRTGYGAILLVLVESGVLVARPGLTVGEVDALVTTGAPTAAVAVARAGRVLADVVYGGRRPSPREADEVAEGLRAVARATGRRDLDQPLATL